jgi:hypothetical protein
MAERFLLVEVANASHFIETMAPKGELKMSRDFHAYAGPSIWGDWVSVADHLGVVTYNITAEAVGNTVLRSRVRYFSAPDHQVVDEFGDSVTITTGNVVASVEVSFKGVPLGSAVDGTIEP